MSPSASLLFIGKGTEYTTETWPFLLRDCVYGRSRTLSKYLEAKKLAHSLYLCEASWLPCLCILLLNDIN